MNQWHFIREENVGLLINFSFNEQLKPCKTSKTWWLLYKTINDHHSSGHFYIFSGLFRAQWHKWSPLLGRQQNTIFNIIERRMFRTARTPRSIVRRWPSLIHWQQLDGQDKKNVFRSKNIPLCDPASGENKHIRHTGIFHLYNADIFLYIPWRVVFNWKSS